jgi:hypothetical protein
MSVERDDDHEVRIRRWLDPDEPIHASARARDVALAVSDRRLVIVERDRLALDVPFERVRRVQFDIERDRPATLVIVPEHPEDEPQVLPIPKEEYRAVADALVAIGMQLYQTKASQP